MKTRLGYVGGSKQEDRMISDKLRSLKKALLYSYQAATAILEDGREFRCLINPDKTKTQYKDKIISIPYEDICLGRIIDSIDENTGEEIRTESIPAINEKTSKGIEPIGLKVGDVFEWKETGTFWLVYLQYLEEDAYFRAEIRNCDYEINIDGKKYRGYLRGPDETDILWHTKRHLSWTDPNYSLLLYITNQPETRDFFHRFNIIEIEGKPWEVQVADSVSNEGLLIVSLKEGYRNELEKKDKEEEEEIKVESEENNIDDFFFEEEEENLLPVIVGPSTIYPYDTIKYKIENSEEGTWSIDNTKKAIVSRQNSTTAIVEVITGRSGEINLKYKRYDGKEVINKIIIASL